MKLPSLLLQSFQSLLRFLSPLTDPCLGLPRRLDAMTPARKAGWVAAGYLAAVLVGATAVMCHLILVGGPSSPNYTGPNAFSDFLLFFALFGIVSVPATCAVLFFLRSDAAFWRRSSVAALVFAVLAIADSVAVIFAPRSVVGQIGFVGLLGGPMLALAFCLSGVFSPNRVSRTHLFAAGITEGAAFAAWAIACLVRNR